MDILYFAFANDRDQPLDELKREDAEINRLLEPLAARGLFRIVRDSFATLDMVADKLSLYKNDLVLFHFSGHAGPDCLQLDGETARSKGIAALLDGCPRLQVVVLNGCATYGQVALLHDNKVPAVIATHRPVGDKNAASFAIQFYRSLAQLDTLEGAFNAARGKTLAIDAELDISRGLALRTSTPEAPCWGLSITPGREDVLNWRLPSGGAEAPDDYVANQLLLDTLLQALAPYRSDIQRIIEDEENENERDILDKRDEVLIALPHPISEQLRFLFAPSIKGREEIVFNLPGPNRLKRMVLIFDMIAGLMLFAMLAQLWDLLSESKSGDLTLQDDTREAVRRLLKATVDTRSTFDVFELISILSQFFDKNKIAYYVEELEILRDVYQKGTPFYDACRFFIEIKPRLGTIGAEAVLLSVLAETHLSNLLAPLGFMARYTIASIKNIDVLKNRSVMDPRYRHIIVKLVQRLGGIGEVMRTLTKPMDNSSVLLMLKDESEEHGFLNLTPFVIDENAFDEKATVAKLHYFERYLPDQDAYAFRHIYMPEDMPLLIGQQKNFKMLKAQFETFAKLLFNKPMRDL